MTGPGAAAQYPELEASWQEGDASHSETPRAGDRRLGCEGSVLVEGSEVRAVALGEAGPQGSPPCPQPRVVQTPRKAKSKGHKTLYRRNPQAAPQPLRVCPHLWGGRGAGPAGPGEAPHPCPGPGRGQRSPNPCVFPGDKGRGQSWGTTVVWSCPSSREPAPPQDGGSPRGSAVSPGLSVPGCPSQNQVARVAPAHCSTQTSWFSSSSLPAASSRGLGTSGTSSAATTFSRSSMSRSRLSLGGRLLR